ncbi:hypothetical protein Pd630_LPD03668 [Rhodococcus opacus PD630]|nr:hypothetical protein Pd630_LPD03668 [Rhodococcus opacus PD630]
MRGGLSAAERRHLESVLMREQRNRRALIIRRDTGFLARTFELAL